MKEKEGIINQGKLKLKIHRVGVNKNELSIISNDKPVGRAL